MMNKPSGADSIETSKQCSLGEINIVSAILRKDFSYGTPVIKALAL